MYLMSIVINRSILIPSTHSYHFQPKIPINTVEDSLRLSMRQKISSFKEVIRQHENELQQKIKLIRSCSTISAISKFNQEGLSTSSTYSTDCDNPLVTPKKYVNYSVFH